MSLKSYVVKVGRIVQQEGLKVHSLRMKGLNIWELKNGLKMYQMMIMISYMNDRPKMVWKSTEYILDQH